MPCFSTLLGAGLAALALCLPASALAQSGARGSISLGAYELTDLDDSDGVTPWLSWETGGPMQATASAGIWGDSDYAWDRARFHFGLSPNTSVVFFADVSLATFGQGARAAAEILATVGDDPGRWDEAWVWDGDSAETRLAAITGALGPAAAQGWVEIATSSRGVAPAVPEPATSVMLLGGAGILMIVGRRRRY